MLNINIRQRVSNQPFVVASIIPTGVRAEIGGFAGDATPSTNLLASACDYLVTNPNAVTGSDIYFGQDNVLYLEGNLRGSQGVLTTCALLGTQYQKVAIALNSHISTINGIILAGLEPYFIDSESLMPNTDEVITALETSGVSVLLLTHPSYEGVTIDLATIANSCQKHGIALAIDEPHGSHFPFLDEQWRSGISVGADIVSHSMHKYAGSLVQTGLLHFWQNLEKPGNASFAACFGASTWGVGSFQFTGVVSGAAHPSFLIHLPILR